WVIGRGQRGEEVGRGRVHERGGGGEREVDARDRQTVRGQRHGDDPGPDRERRAATARWRHAGRRRDRGRRGRHVGGRRPGPEAVRRSGVGVVPEAAARDGTPRRGGDRVGGALAGGPFDLDERRQRR